MQETVSLGLSNPTFLVRTLFHIGFLVMTFFAFEGIDYAKIMRKTHYRQGILVHTLLCIAVSYLVTKFFLTILFKAYM